MKSIKRVYILNYFQTKRLYEFAMSSITNYKRLAGLNERNLFSYSFGGKSAMNQVQMGLDSSEASLLSWQLAIFFLYFYMVFSLCCLYPNFLSL